MEMEPAGCCHCFCLSFFHLYRMWLTCRRFSSCSSSSPLTTPCSCDVVPVSQQHKIRRCQIQTRKKKKQIWHLLQAIILAKSSTCPDPTGNNSPWSITCRTTRQPGISISAGHSTYSPSQTSSWQESSSPLAARPVLSPSTPSLRS